MKLILITVSMIAMLTTAARADEWTETDTALQVVFVTATVMDWRQTLWIADSCGSITKTSPIRGTKSFDYCSEYETNRVLGEHPSKGAVNSYFALSLVAHAGIAYILPQPYRGIWQNVWIGIEAETVRHNYAIGISATW